MRCRCGEVWCGDENLYQPLWVGALGMVVVVEVLSKVVHASTGICWRTELLVLLFLGKGNASSCPVRENTEATHNLENE